MTRAAIIRQHGGPDVIEWTDVDLPPPGPGEVQVETRAVGLNFIDVYHRSGLYPGPLPGALGMEGVGVVTAIGDNAGDLAPGDRVATFGPQRGAYATARNLPAAVLFKLPEAIDDRTAAAVLLKGCTAEFLAERAATIAPGDAVLVHAAAGGVGLILVPWLKARGARVIGTVGSDDKVALAKEAGADEVLLASEDIAARVGTLTGGAGVRVTYDGVGAATWEASLKATGRRGLIVSYGNASGPVAGVTLGALSAHGSLFVTRPTLFDYFITADERRAGAARLWAMIASGTVKVAIGQTFALEDVADAHRALEGRQTTGSTLLLP